MIVRSGMLSFVANDVNSWWISLNRSCGEVDEVHLVDAQHEVRHPQQRQDHRVAA